MVPTSTESKFVASNGFFTAIPIKAKGGGQLAVLKVEDYCKFGINDPMLKGHSGAIIDFQFNPFIDNLLATASEDGTVALWTIPLEGLNEDLKTPNAILYGHSKKLTHLEFNPSAENVLATAAFDKDVKIWDAYQGKEHTTISGLIGQPTCMEWNYDGSTLAIADRSKRLHVFDPRDQSGAVLGADVHEGPKQIKCCWLGESNRVLTTGMSKSLYKEIAIWDSRDLSKPLIRNKSEKNIEVSEPFFDPMNNLVYLAVKGEARVNIWELINDDKMIEQVGSFKGEGSHRGFSFMPKRFVDVMSSELMRGVRLTDKNCEYVSFKLPKKKGAFVPGLYNRCPTGDIAKTFDQWVAGESAPPPTMEVTPDLASTIKMRVHDGNIITQSEEESKGVTTEVVTVAASSSAADASAPKSSNAALNKPSEEVEQIKKTYERKITELEEKLNQQTTESAPTGDGSDEVEKLRSENQELSDRLLEMQTRIDELERAQTLKDKEIEDLKRVRNEKLQKQKAE